MSAVLVFWPSRPPYQEGSLLLGPSVFGVLVVLSFRWTSFLSGVKSTAMLYLFGSFSVLSDESTIYKYRGGISLLVLSEFIALRSSRSKRVPAFSRETTSVMLVHQTVPSVWVLTTSNFTQLSQHFEASWLFFAVSGRTLTHQEYPSSDKYCSRFKGEFFLFVVGDQRVRSYLGFYWV